MKIVEYMNKLNNNNNLFNPITRVRIVRKR